MEMINNHIREENDYPDRARTLPPMKFICELPPLNNPTVDYLWSNSKLLLPLLGPVLAKHLQTKPYAHQAKAIPQIIQGKDILLNSGTGSGKSEAFLFPILELLLQKKITSVILFYHSKQLIQDQEKRLEKYLSIISKELGVKITYSSYTGDLSTQALDGIESACPNILLATFDKLFFRRFKQDHCDSEKSTEENLFRQKFFTHISSAQVIVFDEIHMFSGLLLSNVHNFIHLHKACNPTCRVILSSATIAEIQSFRNKFLPSAEIITGSSHRGTIQVLAMDKQYLEQLNNYIYDNYLFPKESPKQSRRIIFFNDNISENEAFTYQIKEQMANATGITLQAINDTTQDKIACIHSQLPPERKQDIVLKTRENELCYLISTDLLAQGVDFPDFHLGIQVGWPITGLAGALQRIGRIRFGKNLTEVRYFIFIFDSENTDEGYFLASPKELANKLLKGNLPPLIFARENFSIIQGDILLALSFGITSFEEIKAIFCKGIIDASQVKKIHKIFRQALTKLIAQGIVAITEGNISFGSAEELTLFLQKYHLRPIPPKWEVKEEGKKETIFTIDSRKILKEALPGNVLLNDGCFWKVTDIDQRTNDLRVVKIIDSYRTIDFEKIERNKCSSPEFSFGRFTQENNLRGVSIQYGDLSITQKPSKINIFDPVLGFQEITLEENNYRNNYVSDLSFEEQSTGIVLTFDSALLKRVLNNLEEYTFSLLLIFTRILIQEACRKLDIVKNELITTISWQKGNEGVAIYDMAGPNGNSQKIFLEIKQLLKSIQQRFLSCSCSTGCSACFSTSTKIFPLNSKTILLRLLEEVLP